MLNDNHINNIDQIEDLELYYDALTKDAEKESANSLYATTPENPNEQMPDDEIGGEDAIYNLHKKFKKFKRIKEKEKFNHLEPKFPLVEFLNVVDSKGMLPKSTGLINK